MRRSSHRGAEIHAQWTRILCQRLSCPRAPATDSFTAATSYPTAQLNRGNSSTVAVSCMYYLPIPTRWNAKAFGTGRTDVVRVSFPRGKNRTVHGLERGRHRASRTRSLRLSLSGASQPRAPWVQALLVDPSDSKGCVFEIFLSPG